MNDTRPTEKTQPSGEQNARDFDLADILSITTGRLLSHDHIDGIYRILNHLTGDDLFTHQLPRATAACRPVLLAQHPQLIGVQPPDGMGVPALLAWIAEQEECFGGRLPVSPAVHWERRNPIAELVGMVGPERVIPVVIGP